MITGQQTAGRDQSQDQAVRGDQPDDDSDSGEKQCQTSHPIHMGAHFLLPLLTLVYVITLLLNTHLFLNPLFFLS